MLMLTFIPHLLIAAVRRSATDESATPTAAEIGLILIISCLVQVIAAVTLSFRARAPRIIVELAGTDLPQMVSWIQTLRR